MVFDPSSVLGRAVLGGMVLGSVGGDDTSISDSFSFSDIVTTPTHGRSFSDTVTFGEDLIFYVIRALSFSDTVTFSEVCVRTGLGSASDSVTFSDGFTGLIEIPVAINESLTLSETTALSLIVNNPIFDNLDLIETRIINKIRSVSFSDSLTLNETYVGLNVKFASDSITFSETLTADIAKLIKDNIDFDSIFSLKTNLNKLTADVFEPFTTISVNLYIRRTFLENVTFTEALTVSKVQPVPPESITFNETITQTNSKSLPDTLTLTETLFVNKRISVGTSDSVNFSDTNKKNIAIRKVFLNVVRFIEDTKHFLSKQAIFIDTISFSDILAREVHLASINDSITFSDTISSFKLALPPIVDTLTPIETLDVIKVINLNTWDFVFLMDGPGQRTAQSPPVLPPPPPGWPVPVISPVVLPPRTDPVAVVADQFMLLIGQQRTIVLPPPEFNDFYSDQNKMILKRAMDGTVRTYTKTNQYEKLHYEWVIEKYKAQELKNFVQLEYNQKINVIDWNGRQYDTRLLLDTVDIVEIGRWDPCGNKVRVTLEFLGIRYA